MIDQYVLATNDDGDLAIRTVSATESSSVTDTTSVITATDDGKLAVRVVGAGGGSDQHNLGWYATQAALEEAHPTAEAGDWAIVGSTDTVWLWDTDNEEWVDSDTKGQVTSVNNQTGAVTLGINDVAPTQTGKSGYVLGTDGFVAGWVKPETVQVSALPAASEDEVDNIYQFVGTTNANYTNGYFYKCVSDGQDPATYSWTRTDVQPQAGGLPSQTGQSGKFLTTNGTDASWSNEIPSVVLKGNHNYTLEAFGNNLRVRHTFNNNTTTVFNIDGASGNVQCPQHGILGYNGNYLSKVVTQKIGRSDSANSDISVPVIAGTMAVQVTTVPTAGSTYVGQIYQYIGATDSTYTHGYIYECKAQGTSPETYAWEAVEVQAGGGGGSTALSLTLAAANWSNNTITVTATGVTASNNVIVSPAPASQSAYTTAGVMCTAQASDSLTFTCTTTPSSDLTVTVLII